MATAALSGVLADKRTETTDAPRPQEPGPTAAASQSHSRARCRDGLQPSHGQRTAPTSSDAISPVSFEPASNAQRRNGKCSTARHPSSCPRPSTTRRRRVSASSSTAPGPGVLTPGGPVHSLTQTGLASQPIGPAPSSHQVCTRLPAARAPWMSPALHRSPSRAADGARVRSPPVGSSSDTCESRDRWLARSAGGPSPLPRS
jgi:hypothetical protein